MITTASATLSSAIGIKEWIVDIRRDALPIGTALHVESATRALGAEVGSGM